MLIRSIKSNVKIIPTTVGRSASTASTSTSTSSPTNFKLNTTLQLKLLKAALFGPTPSTSTSSYPSSHLTFQNPSQSNNYRAQAWRESRRRGKEELNRVEKNEDSNFDISVRNRGSIPKIKRGTLFTRSSTQNNSGRRSFSTSVRVEASLEQQTRE